MFLHCFVPLQVLGDKNGDGLCCGYGSGDVLITSANGTELWSDNGRYGDGEEVYLNFSATGDLIWAANNPDGTVDASWGQDPADDDDVFGWLGDDDDDFAEGDDGIGWFDDDGDEAGALYVGWDPSEDPEWPGAFPTPINSVNVVTINIRTDGFPEETYWEWSLLAGGGAWEILDGEEPSEGDTLFSYEQNVQSNELYGLRISDSLSDGTCCLFGSGWFSITSGVSSAEYNEGTLVWSKTGEEFQRNMEAFVWIDEEGMAQEVIHIPGEGYAIVEYTMVSGERIATGERVIVVPETETESVNRHFPGERR